MLKQNSRLCWKMAFWISAFLRGVCVNAQQLQNGILKPTLSFQVAVPAEDLRSTMHQATSLFQKGDYAQALVIFNQVRRLNLLTSWLTIWPATAQCKGRTIRVRTGTPK